MANLKPLMSSAKGDWGTPPTLIRSLETELRRPFAVDLAAREDNRVAPVHIGPGSRYAENALAPGLPEELLLHLPPGIWGRWWWCNPPYGKHMTAWIQQWAKLTDHGAYIVALLPARTDTKWFRELHPSFVREVRLLQGRLQFVGASDPAPFPSMLVFMASAVGRPEPDLRITLERR